MFIDKLIRFCLESKLVVFLLTALLITWGVLVAPFDWELESLPRTPVAVDAIPDIGENQQIVFTKWSGRSPQDVEDQITYPLTVSLLGIPGVKSIRSFSFFGFSSIYVIFKEDVEFYWSRSRILEKLSSLPPGTLPAGISPALGPDATALGQVFWYTLEGRDSNGKVTGGWDLAELRSVQDFQIRYALQSVEGIAEVASIGGFVKEYQIDVDPDAMRAYGVSLAQVIAAVKNSNIDVGARTIEVNSVEYVVRGLGFIKSLSDLENTAIAASKESQVPVYIKDIAKVTLGPALRRGALDKNGAEAVGGVAVVRFGENPLATIDLLKEKIREISPGLPSKTLEDGTASKLTIVPFYDRTGLIHETLNTLESALSEEILVTILVVIVAVFHLGSSLLISGLLPLAVLFTFIFMKLFGVDANIVALSGIAIAIGTMVDMGVVLCESILVHLKKSEGSKSTLESIYEATSEVASAVLTAVLTTIISFLPVFAMEAAEGKLFRPLAFTKTFALISALIVSIVILPAAAHILFKGRSDVAGKLSKLWYSLLVALGVYVAFAFFTALGLAIIALGFIGLFKDRINTEIESRFRFSQAPSKYITCAVIVCAVLFYLSDSWRPFGLEAGLLLNIVFVGIVIGLALYLFKLFERAYPRILSWCLAHKALFLLAPVSLVISGGVIWSKMGTEFMPSLDEGSFLYMPTTMPHASIGESLDQLAKLDLIISQIPEVESTVGKLGRADSPLDPAPISMFENVINYKSEYKSDSAGRILRFKFEDGEFARDANGELVEDSSGKPFRQWRDHINSPGDIWKEIVSAAKIPGLTSAPKLQPIAARLVMLQSGMRAPMGVKVKGASLREIESVGLQIEKFLKEVPSVNPHTVIADRIVGKPYLQIDINRHEIARYGLSIKAVQDVIEVAIGGKPLTTTVEGRERYPVRIRYPRELRSTPEELGGILIPTPTGQQVPLRELATIHFEREAQVIKSEDTQLVGYVVFDMQSGEAETDVVKEAKAYLEQKLESGEFQLPAGVSYSFAGSYENQVRSEKRLALVLPLALLLIFLVLYFQFRSVMVSLFIFSGVFVAWSGGFLMLWLYSQDWFLNFGLFGANFRELFQVREYNLSVAVWVGFLALFGIATDDGVLISTFIRQSIKDRTLKTVEEVRAAVLEAGKRRIRPALMTTATTLLALLPVLTSRGRGSDIMVPMAIPSFGGMVVALLTVLVVPVLYSAWLEWQLRRQMNA